MACICQAGPARGVPSADFVFLTLLALGAVTWRASRRNRS